MHGRTIHFIGYSVVALSAALGVLVLILSPTTAQEDAAEFNPFSPQARATERAARRMERAAMQLSPEARETARAARREEMRTQEQAVAIRDPIPLPVAVRVPGPPVGSGKPAGGVCSGPEPCVLRVAANPREVVVVTAVWSATRVQCDDLTSASPPNGVVITPWWRCQRELVVEGPGAGFAGFIVVQ